MSIKKTLPLYLVFLSMGLVDVVGPMVSLARESFSLPIHVATLLPFLGYMMYGILSIPMGVVQERKGKRKIILLGLIIAFIGLTIPIFSGMYGRMVIRENSIYQFILILVSVLLLGAGGAIMQVGGNPFIRDISDKGQYSRNLSMSQSFITVGSSLGFLLPTVMFRFFSVDWTALFPIYAMIVLTAIFIFNFFIRDNKQTKTQEKKNDSPVNLRSCLLLLKDKYILSMVFGIFVYCGLEAALSSHVPMLLNDKFSLSLEESGLFISWSLFYLPIFIGRFLGKYIMKVIKPKRLLLITGFISFVGLLIILSQSSYEITLIGVFIVGVGFANIFPLIFSITIDRLPQYTNELSGLMVSMIVGGAFIPMIMGFIAHSTTITVAFFFPLVCVCYFIFLGISNNITTK